MFVANEITFREIIPILQLILRFLAFLWAQKYVNPSGFKINK